MIRKLKEEMNQAAPELEFEKAAARWDPRPDETDAGDAG